MAVLHRIAEALRRIEHKTHQYQLILAIIVASIVLTCAFFASQSPLVDPPDSPDRTAHSTR